jgi:hypothetical protein
MKPLLPLLLLAALCGGCETVVFEAPPVAAQACDPALVGHWLSVADKPAENGEVELRIATDCTLLFVEHEHGAPREGEPTALHVGRDGRIAYAWVNARWAETRMASPPANGAKVNRASDFDADDLVLMQYRIAGRRLDVRQADPKQFAHRIIDDRIKGEIRQDAGGDLAVRVAAPVDPRALRDAKLFPRGEMRFRRAAAGG